ncbi:hypothetical protein BH09PSE5_BH09PSE5_41020 [soil metagenome]
MAIVSWASQAWGAPVVAAIVIVGLLVAYFLSRK